MQKPNEKDFKRMMAMLTKHGLQGRRHAFCWEFSQGRTESSKELYNDEVLAIINAIENHFQIEDKADVMRKKIIALAHDMHWQLSSGKADMQRVNNWCIEKGPYKKALNKHTIKELSTLVSVFEKVYKDYMKKL